MTIRDNQPPRPRSERDVVPKFKDGEDALAWMEKKLDGSWCDQEAEEEAVVEEEERGRLLESEGLSMDDFNRLMGFG